MEGGQLAARIRAQRDRNPSVSKNGADFVGRRWVFERLNRWLETGGRYFHLVGEPGSGKTALSRQLVHIAKSSAGGDASGNSAVDAGFPRLRAGFIDASHFCSARDRRLVNPLTFAESLGAQLA